MSAVKSILLSLVLMLSLFRVAQATHLRAADIQVTPVCGDGLTFKITILAYLNTNSNTRFGTNSLVNFGDGLSVRIPMTQTVSRPDLGTNIGTSTFTVTHRYVSYGNYTITYQEHDRSSGVVNITNSKDVAYATFLNFTISPAIGCNNYPVLSVPPLDRACHAATFFHNPGAYDVDGDSLSYELTIPSSDLGVAAAYTNPVNTGFYVNYNQGNEAGTGIPLFSIDAVSGLLTWDAPGMLGEYNIAFKIVEWRKDPSTEKYSVLSTTTRDMQIIVEECDNRRPELQLPADICVEAGTLIDEIILGTDADNDQVKIEVFSEIVELDADHHAATYSPSPAVFVSSNPAAQLHIQWQTDCAHVRNQSYQVVFKITDSPPDGPRLVSFKTWNIKVVAPAPVWTKTELDVVKRYATLEWEDYYCTNADKIQIWRKVDSYAYNPGLCNPGLPRYLGYRLIAEVVPSQTKYIDTNDGKGLVAGARYCYRIMAYFNAPATVPSMVSTEACIGPIQADAPVITHVSVVNTSFTDGSIRVSWRSPFAINVNQFPRPYEYEVYRANDFMGEEGIHSVKRISDTTFVDEKMNTEEHVFNYRVVVYSKPVNASSFIPVDTSAVASSVRLSAIPSVNKIELAWRDTVPWSNVVQQRPYHLIYRATGSDAVDDMVLIDSVNVAENGFNYTDEGKYKNEAVQQDKMYAYRVLTRGTYGNPAIALQENYSQVVTSYPENTLVPCTQQLEVSIVNCEEYIAKNTCDQTEFSNTLRWSLKQAEACRKDIKSYNIYASATPDGNYELLASLVRDTFYVDTGLKSYARCYRISAVDGLGQESALSDSVCNDNCPYYMLPNVFTPNDDRYNDHFSADFDHFVQAGVTTAVIRCPRFVKGVTFRVYNRWGNEIYKYASDETNSIYIEWDGKDSNGKEMDAGVYFYSAHITFDVLSPSQQKKDLKGWVQLVR